MTAKWIPALAILGVIAAFAVGCGGSADSSGGNGSESSLSKAKFIKTANKICYDGKEEQALQLQQYIQENPSNRPPNDAGVEAVQSILLPSVRDQVDQVRELGAPRGDERTIEATLDGLEKATDKIEAESISKDGEIRAAFRPAGDIALEYGLGGCAYGH